MEDGGYLIWKKILSCLILSKCKKQTNKFLRKFIRALEEKDYNPIDQLVGYLISGDPSYITSYNNARTMIKSIDRDELIAEMLREYVDIDK